MKDHYLLGEVAGVLDCKPHRIVHLLATRAIPEPELRISNKRLFSAEDVVRLARHFKVTPRWEFVEAINPDAEAKPVEGLTLRPPFEVVSTGQTGHEVKDGDGMVFGWAVDRAKALVVAGLLEAAARG